MGGFRRPFTDHHGYLLTKMLARVEALSVDIADLDTNIEARPSRSRTRWPPG